VADAAEGDLDADVLRLQLAALKANGGQLACSMKWQQRMGVMDLEVSDSLYREVSDSLRWGTAGMQR